MTIAKEEIFGPVLVMIKYNNEEEAINIANDTEYGLAGYVQGDPDHAREVARKIRAGQVIINGGARGTGAPFGGYKASGNGREHGLHGLEECLETKAIIAPQINLTDQAAFLLFYQMQVDNLPKQLYRQR